MINYKEIDNCNNEMITYNNEMITYNNETNKYNNEMITYNNAEWVWFEPIVPKENENKVELSGW